MLRNRLIIYSSLFKAIFLNERKKLNLFHPLNNASEIVKILDRGFAFIHINKNGGSSVEKVLNLRDQVHLPYYAIEDILGVGRAKNIKIFTMVRNPYDRIVSQYHYRLDNNQYGIKDKNLSFKDFCRLAYLNREESVINYPLMFKTQYDWLKDYKNGINHVDYIGKFENFNDSLVQMAKLINLDINSLVVPQKRSSKREKDWELYYDDETRNIIYNFFKIDFESFDYPQ